MAKSKAQQAAIAISMKSKGKKPKSGVKGMKYSNGGKNETPERKELDRKTFKNKSEEDKQKLFDETKEDRRKRRKGAALAFLLNPARFLGEKAGKAIREGKAATQNLPKGIGREVTRSNVNKLLDAIKQKGISAADRINKSNISKPKPKTKPETKPETKPKNVTEKKTPGEKDVTKKPVTTEKKGADTSSSSPSKFAKNLSKDNLAKIRKDSNVNTIGKKLPFSITKGKERPQFNLTEIKGMRLKRTKPTLKRK
jgi:hypothetical protein